MIVVKNALYDGLFSYCRLRWCDGMTKRSQYCVGIGLDVWLVGGLQIGLLLNYVGLFKYLNLFLFK